MKRILMLTILIALGFCFTMKQIRTTEASSAIEDDGVSRVIFLWKSEKEGSSSRLILGDGNGNNLRLVGYFSGSASISDDGRWIVAGCQPSAEGLVNELCVVDVDEFLDQRKSIPVDAYDYSSAISAKILLPDECKLDMNDIGMYSGISSLDWSPDTSKILLVCRPHNVSHVCILTLDREPDCWDEDSSKDIYRAIWSPLSENQILTAGWGFPVSNIYLVDLTGRKTKKIAEGLNPVWSYDGKHIIYMEKMNNGESGVEYGIAQIGLSGYGHIWLYQPVLGDGKFDVQLEGRAAGKLERLALSPDGDQLLFSGTFAGTNANALFILDISTGEISYFVDRGIFDSLVAEPDWGL